MTTFALLLFPELTQLDLTGPYEVFCRCPDARVELLWKDRAPVRTEHGLMLAPTATLAEVGEVDVLCVPGGFGVNALLTDAEVLGHLRRLAASARYLTSVCTGALVLGAAGLLQGRRATTHWSAREFMPAFGALPTAGRVVRDGNLLTGGGVTAGIDLALTVAAELYGRPVAEGIQLAIEYDPHPPFAAGHPDQAPAERVAAVLGRIAPRQRERAACVARAAGLLV